MLIWFSQEAFRRDVWSANTEKRKRKRFDLYNLQIFYAALKFSIWRKLIKRNLIASFVFMCLVKWFSIKLAYQTDSIASWTVTILFYHLVSPNSSVCTQYSVCLRSQALRTHCHYSQHFALLIYSSAPSDTICRWW